MRAAEAKQPPTLEGRVLCCLSSTRASFTTLARSLGADPVEVAEIVLKLIYEGEARLVSPELLTAIR